MPIGALIVPVGAMQVTKLLRKEFSFLRESGLLDNFVPVVAERHFVANALFKALNGVVRIKRFFKRQVFAFARVDFYTKEFFELIVH